LVHLFGAPAHDTRTQAHAFFRKHMLTAPWISCRFVVGMSAGAWIMYRQRCTCHRDRNQDQRPVTSARFTQYACMTRLSSCQALDPSHAPRQLLERLVFFASWLHGVRANGDNWVWKPPPGANHQETSRNPALCTSGLAHTTTHMQVCKVSRPDSLASSLRAADSVADATAMQGRIETFVARKRLGI
jgi:hypothetical protein